MVCATWNCLAERGIIHFGLCGPFWTWDPARNTWLRRSFGGVIVAESPQREVTSFSASGLRLACPHSRSRERAGVKMHCPRSRMRERDGVRVPRFPAGCQAVAAHQHATLTQGTNTMNARQHDSHASPSSKLGRAAMGMLALLTVLITLAPQWTTADERTISRETLRDKIRGGWAGQMIGVAYGAPTEFHAQAKTYDGELKWQTGMLENTIHQDDLYVEMTFSKVMDDLGLEAKSQDYGKAFRDSKYSLWHANAGARRALNQGIVAPWSGHPKYNFHANDIDFQIEADFIGLMCPGLPVESNKYCDRVGRVMNYGDGLYGGMFVCGMYSAAYFENDPRKIVAAGLACIPADSEYGRLIRDLLTWSEQNPSDWKKVWQMVEDKWDVNDPCPDGFQTPFNIDAKINGAYIAIGLLFGGGDFQKTIEISTRCGQDSDCNPSSAAGVLGVVLGYNQIPAKFVADLPSLENSKFEFTDYSFNEIVASTEKRALEVIRQTGGRVTDAEVIVNVQTPVAPQLEQWSPGIPERRIPVADAAWRWTGTWKPNQALRVAAQSGSEAALDFEGVAIAVLGKLDQTGGRANVYLDGKKQEVPLDAFIVPNTSDEVLWQAYGLAPGHHSLRIVVTGTADTRSKGTNVAIAQALVYKAAEAAALSAHPDSSQWSPLFANDLSDAKFPPGIWSCQDGVLTATEDQCIWTGKEYENFVLDLEFKTDDGTNSGVIVYCSNMEDWIPNSVEIQIADDFSEKWSKSPKTWQCAAIFGHLAAKESAVKKPGEWNRMTVTCQGPKIGILLNGRQVTDIDMQLWKSAKTNPDGSEIPPWLSTPLAELKTRGYIGLQGKHAGAPIYFRNLRIKPIDK